MNSNQISLLVRTFLMLDDIEKVRVAKKVGAYDDKLNSLHPHARDKSIFILVKERGLIDAMWAEVDPLKKVINNLRNEINE